MAAISINGGRRCRNGVRGLSTLHVLIALNIVMSMGVGIAALVQLYRGGTLFPVYHALGLPSQPGLMLRHPWSILTYMVTQLSPVHLVLNLAWLLVFGRIVERTVGGAMLAGIYLVGGVAAAAAFVLLSAFGGDGGYLLGASGAVLAITGFCWGNSPGVPLRIPLLGVFRLWQVAGVATLFTLCGARWEAAPFAAHLAGVAAGVIWGWRHRLARLRGGSRHVRTGDRESRCSVSDESGSLRQAPDVDEIVEKIRVSGFESLSDEEKGMLTKS